jgi:hypothetical protein
MSEKQKTFIFHSLHTGFVILTLISIIFSIPACKPNEIDLPFETIEENFGAPGTGHLYENREPGLILISQPEEVTNFDGLIT